MISKYCHLLYFKYTAFEVNKMTCFSLVLDHLHNYKEGSWKRVNEIIPTCKLKIFQLIWQDVCENHANVVKDILRCSSVICLYAKASLSRFATGGLCLGKRVVEQSKKWRFIRDLYYNVTGGVGEQCLNLFSGKSQVDWLKNCVSSYQGKILRRIWFPESFFIYRSIFF